MPLGNFKLAMRRRGDYFEGCEREEMTHEVLRWIWICLGGASLGFVFVWVIVKIWKHLDDPN
jgi:NhaP-type Na+/H+ or K+/H+ antiporter